MLGMRPNLLPGWKACVQGYDRSSDPQDAFFQIYLALIDCVAYHQLVNINGLLEACLQGCQEEANINLCQWQYSSDLALTEAYRESMLSDWVEMSDWLDEFLVEAQLGQSVEDLW